MPLKRWFRFLADPLNLDPEDRVALSIYLALAEDTRTPAALAERRETLRHMGTMFAALAAANATGKPRSKIRDAQEAILTGRIGIEPTDAMTLSMMFASMAEVAQIISNLPWVLRGDGR